MKLLVLDDFLKDPMKERQLALEAKYKSPLHNGINYRGIAETHDLPMRARIDEIMGSKSVDCTTFWRRYLASEESETFIHSDVQIGHVTAILYLSLPEHCRGGTAFWKHRLYGWEGHPDPKSLGALGLRDEDELWKSVHKDGFDEFKWEMTDYVPLYFNRLILFRSALFHSRHPKKAFGTSLANSRLIKVFFLKYEVKGDA